MLALAQSRAFIQTLLGKHAGLAAGELQVVTSGDRIQDRPLYEVGGKGLFVKEIEEALFAKTADLAVHSMKDVPSVMPDGLAIVCTPKRADARDALISPKYGTLANLPEGATVGTSSLRRQLVLKRTRPDLRFLPLRGNVDTRLRKVEEGECDAIILARAGLDRLGKSGLAMDLLSPEASLPAVAQGALGIEARIEDEGIRAILAAVHDHETGIVVGAERGVLAALEGDCRTPIAAYATHEGETLRLRTFVAEPDGSKVREIEESIAWPNDEKTAEAFGRDIGARLRH